MASPGYRRVHGTRVAAATNLVSTSKEGVKVATFGRWRRDVTTAPSDVQGTTGVPTEELWLE